MSSFVSPLAPHSAASWPSPYPQATRQQSVTDSPMAMLPEEHHLLQQHLYHLGQPPYRAPSSGQQQWPGAYPAAPPAQQLYAPPALGGQFGEGLLSPCSSGLSSHHLSGRAQHLASYGAAENAAMFSSPGPDYTSSPFASTPPNMAARHLLRASPPSSQQASLNEMSSLLSAPPSLPSVISFGSPASMTDEQRGSSGSGSLDGTAMGHMLYPTGHAQGMRVAPGCEGGGGGSYDDSSMAMDTSCMDDGAPASAMISRSRRARRSSSGIVELPSGHAVTAAAALRDACGGPGCIRARLYTGPVVDGSGPR